MKRNSLPWADSNRRPHSPQELVLNRPFHWDDLLLSVLYQLSYTAYRTIIMRSGFPAPLCLTMWRIKPPPTGGREAHPVNLSLCSPFLDGGVACHLRHWHQLRPIIATRVAPGCIGWNTPTSVPVLVVTNMSKNVSPFIVCGRCWIRTNGCTPITALLML